MRKFIEKLVEGGFLISGSVSSFTILLIIVFLFKEAAGLFNSPEVEEGYILAVNQENPVEHLSPEQIMDVFDANITNWEDLNGENQDILVFRFSDLTNYYTEEELGEEFQYVPEKINELIHKEPGIIAFFPEQYKSENFTGKIISGATIKPSEFFGGTKWYPTSAPAPIFGLIPLLLGTLLVSIGAIALSLPFGVAVAIYMAEIANTKTRNFLKRVIGRYSLSRLWFLRIGGDRSPYPKDLRPSGRRDRFRRKRGFSDHGVADHHHGSGRCHANYPTSHERGQLGIGSHAMANHLQSNNPLLHIRYHVRCRIRYRTCDR